MTDTDARKEDDMQESNAVVHHAATSGYVNAADSYVKGRPDYPPEVALWLSKELGLGPGVRVLDLGAGTGKFTPHLLSSGAQVTAVEPVAAMLQKLAAALPQVETHVGSATAIPLPDASVDAIVCAQSFHWFANHAALAEMHRVLKPHGRLGLIWNMRDARVGWIAKLDAIVNRYEGDTPRYYTGEWKNAFPFAGFGSLQERHFANTHRGRPEDVIVNRVRSTSFIAALPAPERALVDAELWSLIAIEETLRDKEIVHVPYETAAFFTVKTS